MTTYDCWQIPEMLFMLYAILTDLLCGSRTYMYILNTLCIGNRARKSRVHLAWRYEIHAIIGSLGTVRAQPRFRSNVKSMGEFRLLQITVI